MRQLHPRMVLPLGQASSWGSGARGSLSARGLGKGARDDTSIDMMPFSTYHKIRRPSYCVMRLSAG